MSTGGIIGAVVGGVAGFFVGGPVGAMYGAAIGFGLGTMLTMKADVPDAGKAQVSEFNISSASEGVLIADLLGTTKLTGNIFHYGNNRNEEIVETSEAPGGGKGGGGSQSYLVGYKYFLTWGMGLCDGPIDRLYTVFSGDKVIWEGELSRPPSGGAEAYTLDGMGAATFYFGTSDQVANSVLTALLADATLNPAYRHQCYCVFEDCYIGDYNRAPTVRFVVSKTPLYDWTTREIIDTYFYNPACAIYYMLVTKLGIPEEYVDTTSFSLVAETLYNEGNGVTVLMDRQQEALGYIGTIMDHVDLVMFWSVDGKLHLKAIRDDIAVEDMPIVTQDMMLDDLAMERKSWLDTQNEIKVRYPLLVSDQFYKLNVSVASGSGSVSPVVEQTFQFNEGLPVSATPSGGWFFERWSGDVQCLVDSGAEATSIRVPTYQDVDLFVYFSNQYGLSMTASRYYDSSYNYWVLPLGSGLKIGDWNLWYPLGLPPGFTDFTFEGIVYRSNLGIARYSVLSSFGLKVYSKGSWTGILTLNCKVAVYATYGDNNFSCPVDNLSKNLLTFLNFAPVRVVNNPIEGEEIFFSADAAGLSTLNAILNAFAIEDICFSISPSLVEATQMVIYDTGAIAAYKPKVVYAL